MQAWRRILRVGLSLGIVGAVVFLDSQVVHFNSTTVALTLLLAVLGIAARWGLPESLAASLGGMFCFNFFFLPPVGRLSIADPQNWVALIAFVVTAVVASQLSASARRRAAEATLRQHEMEKLYSLSRSLMLMDARSPVAKQIATSIEEVFGFRGVALYEGTSGEVCRAGAGQDATLLPLSLSGQAIGSLALPASDVSQTAQRAIAHLAAIAIERARGQEAASRAEAARQSETL